MEKTLKNRGIIACSNLDGNYDRTVFYTESGILKLYDIREASSEAPTQEIVLKNWPEIERLRDFLNGLSQVEKKEVVLNESQLASA